MKLIDKDTIVAEIERKIEAHKESLKNCDSSISELVLKGSMSAYQNLLYILDTLEVKEVDLDFEKELYKTFGQVKDFTLGIHIAKHFYELGLKAR